MLNYLLNFVNLDMEIDESLDLLESSEGLTLYELFFQGGTAGQVIIIILLFYLLLQFIFLLRDILQ